MRRSIKQLPKMTVLIGGVESGKSLITESHTEKVQENPVWRFHVLQCKNLPRVNRIRYGLLALSFHFHHNLIDIHPSLHCIIGIGRPKLYFLLFIMNKISIR